MRASMASALFVLFALFASPRFTVAQTSPTHSQPSHVTPEKPPSSSNLLAIAPTQTTPPPSHTGFASDLSGSLQARKAWSVLQDRKDGPGLQSLGCGFEASQCAHIRIFQAPRTDSEMIVEAPPGEGGPIQTFRGLPPCPRDFPAPMTAQRFYAVPPMLSVPPRRPSVQPSASQIPSARPLRARPGSDAPDLKP